MKEISKFEIKTNQTLHLPQPGLLVTLAPALLDALFI